MKWVRNEDHAGRVTWTCAPWVILRRKYVAPSASIGYILTLDGVRVFKYDFDTLAEAKEAVNDWEAGKKP